MSRPCMMLPPPVKYGFMIGSGLDIPTGEYITGTHGQKVFYGGVNLITGVVGPGNVGKTTIMKYMALTALSRVIVILKDWTYYGSYDTEVNNFENRNRRLAAAFSIFKQIGIDLLNEGIWQTTDKTIYTGSEYWAEVKKYITEKIKDKSKPTFETVFLERDGVTPMRVPTPTFNDLDSLTQFITSDGEETMEKTELGDSAANMLHARQGLAKSRMLMEMPSVAGRGFNFFLFTAHIGNKMAIPSGPGQPPERKQLAGMRQGEYIKGVSNNFFFLLLNCWLIDGSSPLLTKDKTPEFPYEPGDEVVGDLDLQMVKMKQLRGKNGGSGFVVPLVMSMREGVLSYLTEFLILKDNGRFGLIGNDRNYQLILCPDVNLSRTTVRKKLRESPRLQRAVNILCEMFQISVYHPLMKAEMCSPEELYTKLKEKGYDWEFILDHTRGWHTLNDEEYPGYHLSTPDLCRMAMTDYRPYWMADDGKSAKPEYAKKKIVL